MQINLAMGDVSNMANTERCSNIVLPLVWTEIVSITFHKIYYFQLYPTNLEKYYQIINVVLKL